MHLFRSTDYMFVMVVSLPGVLYSCGGVSDDNHSASQGSEIDTASKVINGTEVPAGKFPDIVELQTYDSQGNIIDRCSGVIYGPGCVVTAAHCVTATAPANSPVSTGSWSVSNIGVMRANSEASARPSDISYAKTVNLYSTYNGLNYRYPQPSVSWDLAVVGMQTRISRTAASLYRAKATPVGATVTITGFGVSVNQQGSTGLGVKRYGINTISYASPTPQYGPTTPVLYWSNSQSSSPTQGNYYGDSGAPVYANNCGPDNCDTLVAIVSGQYGRDPYDGQAYGTNGVNLSDEDRGQFLDFACGKAFQAATP